VSGGPSSPEKTYPKIQLTITVLTCVAACVAAYISWQNAAPEQRRTLADTEKIQEETAQLKQERVASEPTLSLNYLYINSEGDRLIEEFDPKAGTKPAKLPRLQVERFGGDIPSRKEWLELSRSRLCCPQELHKWAQTHSDEDYLGNILDRTQYLIIQRIGAISAESIELTAERIDLRTALQNESPFSENFKGGNYGKAETVLLKRRTLEPGHGLLIPVAKFLRFEADDLYPADAGVTEDPEYNYGAVYIPRKLSYTNPLDGKRIDVTIPVPDSYRVLVRAGEESGG
jgi:hypothetical protein